MSTDVCRDCAAPLDVEYLDDHKPVGNSDTYEARTPVHDSSSGVSLGEGGTPCVHLKALGENLGMRRLHGKLEFLNPTGSFKDRGTAVMISVAMDHGVTELVEDSSGNAGASVSAYSARAGIKAHVFVPADAPQAKLRQIKVYGAEVPPIEGPRDAVTAAAMDYHRQHGLVYASHMLSPYFAEGTKTFAYEVAQQFDGALPDHIVFPVGNGSLFIGAFKGFCELQAAGRTDKIPRLHCVQARSVMPLVAAFTSQAWNPGTVSRTVAGGIAIAAPGGRDRRSGRGIKHREDATCSGGAGRYIRRAHVGGRVRGPRGDREARRHPGKRYCARARHRLRPKRRSAPVSCTEQRYRRIVNVGENI